MRNEHECGNLRRPEPPSLLRRAVRAALHASACAITIGSAPVATAAAFPPVLDLGSLDGSDGFAVNGIHESDYAAQSVGAAGDVNGDGIGDVIVGAPNASPNDVEEAGEAYVVFGGAAVGQGGSFELADLDGHNGFAIRGLEAKGRLGLSVAGIGDINGDGADDVAVGAPYAQRGLIAGTGITYVIFGGPTVGENGSVDVATLDGSNGFAVEPRLPLGYSGWSVSGAGDVNGDDIADLIIGSPGALYGDDDIGVSYIIFGSAQVGAGGVLDPGAVGGDEALTMYGRENPLLPDGLGQDERVGLSVSGTGDVDGDGFADVLIGGAKQLGFTDDGAAFLVRGDDELGAGGKLFLGNLRGGNGTEFGGVRAYDRAGRSVSGAGDVNGDGIADMLIGAEGVEPVRYTATQNGRCYVVFGASNLVLPASVSLDTATRASVGFQITGIAHGDALCRSTGRAGDVNGDGIGDLVIGAELADPDGKKEAGESYVVFGGPLLGSDGQFDLATLNGANGFTLRGGNVADRAGVVSGAGDVNGDGVDDLIIGARYADPHEVSEAGQAYVVFGRGFDTDSDGVPDANDNCTLVSNADQRDTNGDGFGNACDADLDNSGVVNFTDLGLIKLAFFTQDGDPGFDPDADFNGDGAINFTDLALMKSSFFGPPGPSGLALRAARHAKGR